MNKKKKAHKKALSQLDEAQNELADAVLRDDDFDISNASHDIWLLQRQLKNLKQE